MPTERFEIGSSGSVHVDGTELHVVGWTLTETSEWQETTHSGSEGFYADIPGTMKVAGSFNSCFDLDTLPIPALSAGSIVALILDYEDDNPAITIATAGIDSFEITSEAKGVIKFSCNYHSIDEYTWA